MCRRTCCRHRMILSSSWLRDTPTASSRGGSPFFCLPAEYSGRVIAESAHRTNTALAPRPWCASIPPAFYLQGKLVSTVKSEVVSVRVEPHIKVALQTAAEREMRSLANMVEVMVIAYCRANGVPLEGVSNETLAVVKSKKLS
jgi:hypothetical protein